MGRVRELLKVDGREYWTQFDMGARNTYAVPSVAEALLTRETPHPKNNLFHVIECSVSTVSK